MLALATNGQTCSVAVVKGETPLAQREFAHEMRLLERLLPTIHEALSAAGMSLEDVTLIAADTGPGSFTGMRIGVMTAKALAWARGIPLVGVTSLEAVASAAQVSPVVALIRARPGTAYWQAFDQDGVAVSEPGVAPFEQLVERVASLTSWVPMVLAYTSDLGSMPTFEALSRGPHRVEMLEVSPDAQTIARVARAKEGRGLLTRALDLAPLYVTEPIIGPPPTRG